MSNRDYILKENDYLRKTDGTKDVSWGRWCLSIPTEDYNRLCIANPDLKSPDAKIKTKAMMKFINSTLSMPYRVTENI